MSGEQGGLPPWKRPAIREAQVLRDHLFLQHGAAYSSTRGVKFEILEQWHDKRPWHLHELEVLRDHLFLLHGLYFSATRTLDGPALERMHEKAEGDTHGPLPLRRPKKAAES